MTETTLNAVRKLSSYREKRSHIFQSDGSLEWFVRKNRRELIQFGALVFINGQWHANETQFDLYVLKQGAESALRHTEGDPA